MLLLRLLLVVQSVEQARPDRLRIDRYMAAALKVPLTDSNGALKGSLKGTLKEPLKGSLKESLEEILKEPTKEASRHPKSFCGPILGP